MLQHARLAAGIALLGAWFSCSVASADDDNDNRGDIYYLAAARVYNRHVYDHARMLSQYSSAGNKPVPADVLKEHVEMMRWYLQNTNKSLAKISPAAKSNPMVATKVADMQGRTAKLLGIVDRLEAESAAAESADAKKLIEMTAEMTQALKTMHFDTSASIKYFSPNQPTGWYTDGSFDE